MGLRLYNTLTRTKEDFVPIDPANVRMYVCGPTVYDFAHIGNARPLIVFDVLYRLLRHLYGPDHVTYVRNITDVDDKINARAAEEYPDLPLNEAIRLVTERTTKQFHEDVAALGCLKPTVEPRATEHIAEMKAMIETLVDKGFAYVSHDHALFHVAAMKDYGRLSNRSLDEMIAGARVEVAPYKRDPMDFVLWKPSKPGEPAWDSPSGIAAPGRPGWHLECSAMSDRWLWQEAHPTLSEAGRAHPHEFDIHGGGIDLVFPHHENEIAQSRCAHGTDVMARYWLHNGFLQVEGEKMSKSLGNFVTIRELLEQGHHGSSVRFTMLKSHYRQPINWTESGLIQGSLELEGLVKFAEGVEPSDSTDLPERFEAALTDDLNTPLAIAELHEYQKEVLKAVDAMPLYQRYKNAVNLLAGRDVSLSELQASFDRAHKIKKIKGNRIALDVDALDHAFEIAFDQKANRLVAARAAARKAKNFAEADRIRAELDAMGIALKDAKDPATGELVTTWEVKR